MFTAVASQKASDLEAARDLFAEAVKEDPKYAKAAYDLALTCQQLSDYDVCAEGVSRRPCELEPDYVEARLAYAGALLDQGDADEAIRQLREVIRLDPGNAWAYSQLSLACLNVVGLAVRNSIC